MKKHLKYFFTIKTPWQWHFQIHQKNFFNKSNFNILYIKGRTKGPNSLKIKIKPLFFGFKFKKTK